jgi:nucleoside-diphosphate-sugar epimerase
MQTILGSTGVIGTELAKELPKYSHKIRLVSRSPKRINPDDELFPADLTNAEQTLKAVEGSDVVYLTVGLEYDLKVWRSKWPQVMNNVIAACKKHNSKLIFFDNVYSYGKVDGWMTEETPHNPSSEKGKVRALISEMLLNEIQNGTIKGMILRAADFYGPKAPSIINAIVFDKFANGKKGLWMMNDNVRHSFTYTPDAGKAVALLGNTEDAYNQVWHLPTDKNVMPIKEFIELAAKEFKVEPKYSVMGNGMLMLVGLFNKNVKENMEMLYQLENDYLFDSSKFEKRFNIKPTPYKDGIKETVKQMKQN